MTNTFWKMHGAGNDFIVFDDRSGTFPLHDTRWLAAIAARRTGIGCEGIILLQTSKDADFRMRFFNPNGHPAEMCGNGARCAARLAFDLGMVADAKMTIATDAGMIRASVTEHAIELSLPPPTGVTPYCELDVDGAPLSCGLANTGVPHVVLEVQDLDETLVVSLGRRIRHHLHFAPEGTNVNFVQRITPSTLAVRTYERGVEDETGACGTGVTAAAIIMALRKRATAPITVTTRSGDQLCIAFDITNGTVDTLTLSGPAVLVYKGSIPFPKQ